MRILKIEPERHPERADIPDTLEAMQEVVGGYVQAVYPFEEPVALICNEEGKLNGLPLNRALWDEDGNLYDIISGTFFLLKMDMNTTRFVRNLLLEQPAGRRIAFPSGNQTVYVNPYTILYAQSRDKRTELVCVDRVVSCNYIYRELKERLPEVFYPLRRGYLVNTLYIVALRRFEAELISGISIPIPALTYTQVKRDLQELIEKK